MKVFSAQLISPLEDLPSTNFPSEDASLVFIHASPFALEDPILLKNFRERYPNADILGCSSAGGILNGEAFDNSIVFSVLQFDRLRTKSTRIEITELEDEEYQAGQRLAENLEGEDLQLIVIFCEGLGTDCDQLIAGIENGLTKPVPISGGLAGDNFLFDRTVVLDRNGVYGDGAVAVGIYGDALSVNRSSSIFDMEGIDLEITQSSGNSLIEINGRPALEEYARILGDCADLLPGISVNFPFTILDPETKQPLYCRTPHEILEDEQSILGAGEFPLGPARLIDLRDDSVLLEDAKRTAQAALNPKPEFAFIVNCAARRASLGDSWRREIEVLHDTWGADVPSFGFHSYGEIGACRERCTTIVHNHTINIFTLNEA